MTTTGVPCLKCKVSIHADTAPRNGGLCMPCGDSLSPRTAARREVFMAAFATAEAHVRQQRAAEESTLEIAGKPVRYRWSDHATPHSKQQESHDGRME